MNYYAVKCNKCNKWSVRQIKQLSKYRFLCHNCKNNIKLKKDKEWGLTLQLSQGYYSIYEARDFIKSKTNSLNTGFETYKRVE
jgi:hypothetical protein